MGLEPSCPCDPERPEVGDILCSSKCVFRVGSNEILRAPLPCHLLPPPYDMLFFIMVLLFLTGIFNKAGNAVVTSVKEDSP